MRTSEQLFSVAGLLMNNNCVSLEPTDVEIFFTAMNT